MCFITEHRWQGRTIARGVFLYCWLTLFFSVLFKFCWRQFFSMLSITFKNDVLHVSSFVLFYLVHDKAIHFNLLCTHPRSTAITKPFLMRFLLFVLINWLSIYVTINICVAKIIFTDIHIYWLYLLHVINSRLIVCMTTRRELLFEKITYRQALNVLMPSSNCSILLNVNA